MWSRRRVLGHVAASGAAWWTGRLAWVAGFPQVIGTEPLRLGVITAPEHETVTDGLVFGTEEAEQSARLFRRTLEVTTVRLPRQASGEAATRLIANGYTLLVTAVPDAERCARVAEAAAGSGAAVLNAACAADVLRGPRCAPHLFHVAASETMYREAVRLALSRGSDSTATAALHAVMWHPDLERFGAGQLNQRFESRFGRPMSGDAWATWMALKIGVEAFLRARSGDANVLRTFLTSEAARFDGHKGSALSFRPWDRQLRQPLYVIQAASANASPSVTESPPRGGVAGSDDPHARLDVLAGPQDASTCRKHDQ